MQPIIEINKLNPSFLRLNWGWCMVFSSLILIACKKEALPDLGESNEPIYNLSGSIDGESLDLQLGKGDAAVTYGLSEENGMPTFYGLIESESKNQKIKFEIIQNEKSKNGDNYAVFNADEIPFLVHEKGRVQFDFGGVGNQNNFLFLQDRNGNFIKTDILEMKEFGNVELSVIFYDYGNHAFKFMMQHGYHQEKLVARFTVNSDQNTIELFSEQENYSNEWYLNDVLVGTDQNYAGSLEDGIHVIKHIVRDQDGNKAEAFGLVRFKGGKNFWTMDMNYLPEYEFESYNFGRMMVSVFQNDEWYSTNLAASNKSNNMKVSNVKFIPNSEKNKPLIGFDLDFSAYLANSTKTDSVYIENMTGRFCLGLN